MSLCSILELRQWNVPYALILCVFKKYRLSYLANFCVKFSVFFFSHFQFPFLPLFFFPRPIFIFNEVYHLQSGNRKNHTRFQHFRKVNTFFFRVGCCPDLLSLMAIIWRVIPVLSVTIQKFLSRYDYPYSSKSFVALPRFFFGISRNISKEKDAKENIE